MQIMYGQPKLPSNSSATLISSTGFELFAKDLPSHRNILAAWWRHCRTAWSSSQLAQSGICKLVHSQCHVRGQQPICRDIFGIYITLHMYRIYKCEPLLLAISRKLCACFNAICVCLCRDFIFQSEIQDLQNCTKGNELCKVRSKGFRPARASDFVHLKGPALYQAQLSGWCWIVWWPGRI